VEGDPAVDPKERLPSVTTVLSVINKPALTAWQVRQAVEDIGGVLRDEATRLTGAMDPLDAENWVQEVMVRAKRKPDEIRDEAADLGTRCHAYLEAVIRGGALPTLSDDMKPSVDAFWSWYAVEEMDIEVQERMVYSAHYRFAGTEDGVARHRGKKIILDWKTSAGIYPEMALQLAAYWEADGEMTGEWADEAWVIRFPKKEGDEPFEAKQLANIEGSWQTFYAALELWRGLKITQFV